MTIEFLPAVLKLDADLKATPAMQRRYSPAVTRLADALARHFVAPVRAEEERRLVAV